ncbi:hypothetical protein [Streptomyces sp. H27-C3]|uniref:hypothetical protein n=1 Tax=Streptomyces sp. H27-C3 TaxID=3046305 RepID=UPI0032D8D273
MDAGALEAGTSRRSRPIGTADISTLPNEDCCSQLAPPRVSTSTRARLPQLQAVEKRLDLDEVTEALLGSAHPGC